MTERRYEEAEDESRWQWQRLACWILLFVLLGLAALTFWLAMSRAAIH